MQKGCVGLGEEGLGVVRCRRVGWDYVQKGCVGLGEEGLGGLRCGRVGWG